MSRFEETETALLQRLRALKAVPGMTIQLYDVGIPLDAQGYTQEEIMAALYALEQKKFVTFAPGNRLLILKSLQ